MREEVEVEEVVEVKEVVEVEDVDVVVVEVEGDGRS